MCGIVGYIGQLDASEILIGALKRLEYRGYDSAGIAIQGPDGILVRRASGKIRNLENAVKGAPVAGHAGIGHTRWATHGAPEVRNAHPHTAGQAGCRVSVVHNGIIENHAQLRRVAVARGATFLSDTDTETLAHLTSMHRAAGLSPREAAREAVGALEGSFAVAIVFEDDPDHIYAARKGSPLVLGREPGACFIGSDALALAPLTRNITYLQEGDFAVVSAESFEVFDQAGASVQRKETRSEVPESGADLGDYDHFMRKEIDEQPRAIARTLEHYLRHGDAPFQAVDVDFSRIERVLLVACGTAYYACLTARHWFEAAARLPVDIDVASEFRYREPPVPAQTLAIFVSQSGETADTLAALRYARSQGATIAALVNATESSIARESDIVLPILAGPEIGVASTKAFTCQLVALAALASKAGVDRNTLSAGEVCNHAEALWRLPDQVRQVIQQETRIAALASSVATARDVIFLGRQSLHPIALEGALKLKETSYIHAEGYPAGELKHGPIALIDSDVPVIALVPRGELAEKTLSNIEEVRARGGQTILVGPSALAADIAVPKAGPLSEPILHAVPMQLLAYHVALACGTDVDQPRNLAKSVTVE